MAEEDKVVPRSEARSGPAEPIAMPAPTAWPMVLALGVSLVIAGMVTSGWVAVVGAVMALMAAHGWFVEVLPHEKHEWLPVAGETVEISRSPHKVASLTSSRMHQQIEPVETFSLMAGIKGGFAGGTAMIVPAVLYGVIRYHSPWYAVNLLAAGGFPSWANQPNSFIAQFHWMGLAAAIGIHTVTAPLVGLMYAAVLPMFPRKPILTAGFLVPLFWTAILYFVLGLVSPILDQRIDWAWFIPSQLAFGLVTGYVVNRYIHVRSPEFRKLSFAERAGLHSDVRHREDEGSSDQGDGQ